MNKPRYPQFKIGSLVQETGGVRGCVGCNYGIVLETNVSKANLRFYKVYWTNGRWTWKKFDHIIKVA